MKMNQKGTNTTLQPSTMAGTKSKKKAPTKVKHTKTSQQSLKQSQRSRTTSRVSTSVPTTASSSWGSLRHVTVESEDEDDDKPSSVGGTLDADGDTIMELADPLDSGDEQSEDEEVEMSKSNLYFSLAQC